MLIENKIDSLKPVLNTLKKI